MENDEAQSSQGLDVQGEISKIESTPGFILPDDKGQLLRDINRPEYDRLEKLRDAAYQRAFQVDADLTDEDAIQAEKPGEMMRNLKQQSKLITEATTEMDRLVELGFERDEVPLDIESWQLDMLKMQRLHAEQNYLDLRPLVVEHLTALGEPSTRIQMFEDLVNSHDLDKTFKSNVIAEILNWVNRANKSFFGKE